MEPAGEIVRERNVLVGRENLSSEGTFRFSKRVYLRALEERDVGEHYVRWLNDPEINQYMVSGNFPQGHESIRAFGLGMKTPESASFAVCLLENNQHIGNVALRHIDWMSRTADLGILIGERKLQGCGYGSEAVWLATEYAFHTLRLRRLWTGTFNPRAARMFERLGWKHEGTLRQQTLVGGEWRDNLLFGIMAEEFEVQEFPYDRTQR